MTQPKDTSQAHLSISMVKSCFRIVAAVCLMASSFMWAGGLFIVAEVLGIAEELV